MLLTSYWGIWFGSDYKAVLIWCEFHKGSGPEIKYFIFSWQIPFTTFFQSMFKILKNNLAPFLLLLALIFLTKFFNPQSFRVMSFDIRPYFSPKELISSFIYFDLWLTTISIELFRTVFKLVVIFIETRSFLISS